MATPPNHPTGGDSTSHRYALLYNIKPVDPPLPQEELPEGWGAADAVVVTSVVHNSAGDTFAIVGWDSLTGSPPTVEELFKYWLVWADFLLGSLPPNDPRSTLCKIVGTTAAKYTSAFAEMTVPKLKPADN